MNRKFDIVILGVLIALLNSFDGFATHYGLKNQVIEETNPLMDTLWQLSPYLFLFLKISLSWLIIWVSLKIYSESEFKFQRMYLLLQSGLLVLYISISAVHVYWLSLV